jgi:hypothetical protein
MKKLKDLWNRMEHETQVHSLATTLFFTIFVIVLLLISFPSFTSALFGVVLFFGIAGWVSYMIIMLIRMAYHLIYDFVEKYI